MSHLICGEAVVKFHYSDLIAPFAFLKTSLCERFIGSIFGHHVADKINSTFSAVECRRGVCFKLLANNFNSLILELVGVDKRLGSNNTAGRCTKTVRISKIYFSIQRNLPPSLVGLHMNLVNSLVIFGAFMTCSVLQPSLN